MKVGIITYRCGGPGGIETIASSLARALVNQGNEVSVVCSNRPVLPAGISVTRVMTIAKPGSLRHLSFRMMSSFAVHEIECDVLHSFGMTKRYNVFSAQSCHKAGLKILHKHREKLIENPFGSGVANFLALRQEHQNFKVSPTNKIIACSHRTKREILEEYKIDENGITTIPNGIDLERFYRSPEKEEKGIAMIRKAGVPESVPVILFVGNEFARKGLAALIQALPLVKGLTSHLVVAGSGNALPYRQLAARLGIEKSVHFMGSVAEIDLLYSAANLFVLPTLHEAFGLAIIEAMAMDVPVIASACAGAIEDMATNEKNCLTLHSPEQPEEIASAIQRLLDDGALRDRIAQAGMTMARRFPWDEVALQVIEVYRQIVANKKM
jgi:UDP-glucose:(heptosyl)LPS alpha-1,3-glucosyltransferase